MFLFNSKINILISIFYLFNIVFPTNNFNNIFLE